MTSSRTWPTPDSLFESGAIGSIDVQFAKLLQRACPLPDPLLLLGAALTSRAVQTGHVCLDLTSPPPLRDKDDLPLEFDWPELSEWQRALEASAAVSDGRSVTPLVFAAEGRLYLSRYARYERRLAAALESRLGTTERLDEEFLKGRFDHWFGKLGPSAATSGGGEPMDQQRFAAFLALRQRIAVISGGPGTGKTTTVAKLLLLLQEHAAQKGNLLKIELLAPTGKAAQRLAESLEKSLAGVDAETAIVEAIPRTASTIHRALGYSSRSPTRFFRNAAQPLPADVVIVDEASMVDLALMTKLVEAIAPRSRLVLLGDRDQLASVEAGAIFGDIVGSAQVFDYSDELTEQALRVIGQAPEKATARTSSVAPLRDAVAHLRRSYRYAEASGIGKLAIALRERDSDAVLKALNEDGARLLGTDEANEREVTRILEHTIREGYRAYAAASTAEARLATLEDFRILSPHRNGPYGALQLNTLAERVLSEQGTLRPGARFYDGQPVMVTENDYQLELFNGDIGVIGFAAGQPSETRLVSYFKTGGRLRTVPLSRLPAHETVFAMTVHKSQGSEFSRVLLVLPRRGSPILTRELLYTAVTRAKQSVTIVGTRQVLLDGARTAIHRASGLRQRLWPTEP